MINASDLSSKFALDVNSVEALRRETRTDPEQGLRKAAAQFEALLMQMMLKSMREAADSAGSTDSQDTKMYKSMMDQQLTMALAKRGIGLADVMVRQLQGGSAAAPSDAAAAALDGVAERAAAAGAMSDMFVPRPARAPAAAPAPQVNAPAAAPSPAPVAAAPVTSGLPDTARTFIDKLWPHAVDAGRTTGIAPHFIIGQAALESGWGRSEIRMADGGNSHNLFGVKAGRGWQGATADVVTTEYVNGAPVKQVERFRAYGSYADAFKDYANLLAANPRYAQVLNEKVDPAAFARGLQQAGYATDPNYAEKLTRVITGTVMRAGLSG
jgi:flagellar protein FlgJ